jgi:hypothetical protein
MCDSQVLNRGRQKMGSPSATYAAETPDVPDLGPERSKKNGLKREEIH